MMADLDGFFADHVGWTGRCELAELRKVITSLEEQAIQGAC